MKPTRSEAIKAGMARARARGVRLGNPQGAAPLRPGLAVAQRRGAEANRRAADANAAKIAPIIAEIKSAEPGISLRGIARELTLRGVPTVRGGTWTAVQIRAIVRRRG